MASKSSRLARSAFVLAVAAFGAETASGQGVFDPYQPESAPYYNYTTPSLPTNLALPGAAREAGAYQALGMSPAPVSRYNSFGRFLEDYDSSGSARITGPGISYMDVPRGRGRGSLPISKAEQHFYDTEAQRNQLFVGEQEKRAQIEADRSALYKKMTRETDPTRRAQIYRQIQALSAPRGATAAARSGQASSATAAENKVPSRAAASRTTNLPAYYGTPPLLARPGLAENPAEEPRSGSGRAPAASGRTAPSSIPPIEEQPVRSRRPPSAAEAPDAGAGTRQPRTRPEAPPSTTAPSGTEPSTPPLPLPDVPAPR
jgi:hypothetical protein